MLVGWNYWISGSRVKGKVGVKNKSGINGI
jgi:hypothetical protein